MVFSYSEDYERLQSLGSSAGEGGGLSRSTIPGLAPCFGLAATAGDGDRGLPLGYKMLEELLPNNKGRAGLSMSLMNS